MLLRLGREAKCLQLSPVVLFLFIFMLLGLDKKKSVSLSQRNLKMFLKRRMKKTFVFSDGASAPESIEKVSHGLFSQIKLVCFFPKFSLKSVKQPIGLLHLRQSNKERF